MARGLLVEPFYGGSHRAFADGLVTNSKHEIDLLTLPGERWRERMRMGARILTRDLDSRPDAYDFIIATDMLDLPAFLALTRPRFAATPILLYMHENQFTYPRVRGTKLNSWFGQINYLSALAADRVAFNSAYHREDFLAALQSLTDIPNNWLDERAIAEIEASSGVLPVGLDLRWFDLYRPGEAVEGAPIVLWNHRWEFDKAPAMFARAMETLAAEGLPFRVAVAGEPGDNPDPALYRLPDTLGDRLVQFGHRERREDYARLLWDSSIVVSTARHEFFGIGTVEAMYSGCVPVAPAGLNYPALVPASLHANCLYDDEAGLMRRLRALLTGAVSISPSVLREAASIYDWSIAGPEWDAALDALVAAKDL